MQSRRLIPPLLLPPADPAGAKPRRDHRFLDRVSRHEVPKTPGNDDALKLYDPARVSHIPVSQSVRHPSGVAGSLAMPAPRVVGATPLDPGLKSEHPCRGASYPTLRDELNDLCRAQMRHPRAPRIGANGTKRSAANGLTHRSNKGAKRDISQETDYQSKKISRLYYRH